MSHYISQITNSLEDIISELSANPSLFPKNPKTDFSRNRKIDFKTLVGITMNSGGATMSKELLDYFDFNVSTPTVSAYTQQREKVLPDAFNFIFHSFTEKNLPSVNTFKGYRLIACDGSNLTIATNKNDPETMWKHNQFGDISNHLHLNAFYDVLNRVYVDAIVQTAAEYHEYQAAINMAERSNLKDVIFVADRGYENYNLIAHLINNDWKFLIRVKDKHSNGIASTLKLDLKDEFDKDVSITFTRKQTKAIRNSGYKFMPTNQRFDYLPLKSDDTYTINFRIARFPIGENSYEMVVTNLDRFNFPVASLKDIYHLRWGIETSFREL